MHSTAEEARTLLTNFGLTQYEVDAYLALLSLGVAEGRVVSQKSGVPTSKIYDIMTHLEALGLITVQPSRPRKFQAREVGEAIEALKAVKRKEFEALTASLPSLERHLRARAGESPRESVFWNVALTVRDIGRQHLSKAAECKEEYLVYVDLSGCLGPVLSRLAGTGTPITAERDEQDLVRISEMFADLQKHLRTRPVNYRVLVGATPAERNAARAWIGGVTTPRGLPRFRIAEPGRQQFHVLDREGVILVIPNPSRPQQPLGSIYINDPRLAREVSESFEELWSRGEAVTAMPTAQ
ncbi:MAG TPA: helix-turn-helix domain-containing protein [Candidatus Thermoplasmatota archaeon]|nr:helix-turn-helix domain-containing protein [Candidatus Thermoplasmatota archaeon]